MANAIKPLTGPVRRTESGRSRLGNALRVSLAGTGSYVPSRVVTNEELSHLGCDSEWIVQRTGIRERRWAEASQASSDLAYLAALDCLNRTGVSADAIDLLVVATITPDHATPSTACLLQQRLGCVAPAMDLSAACSGFVYALITAAQFVHSGSARNALVVGSEVMSRTVNPADLKTYPLFGDGAGAMLIQSPDILDDVSPKISGNAQQDVPGILAYTLGSEGMLDALYVPAGGSREPLTLDGVAQGRQFMQMQGRSVFKWAVRCVVDSCHDVLSAAGYTMDDVDLLVLHQANLRILEAAVSDFQLPMDRVVINLDRFGNTSAASIPLALDEANQQGRLARGDLVLMCGFGAGLTWGAALVRW